jgi:hypothetical protein
MMKYIIEIDGVESTKYKYNIWSVVEYEDNAVLKDIRVFESDNLSHFLDFMKEISESKLFSGDEFLNNVEFNIGL